MVKDSAQIEREWLSLMNRPEEETLEFTSVICLRKQKKVIMEGIYSGDVDMIQSQLQRAMEDMFVPLSVELSLAKKQQSVASFSLEKAYRALTACIPTVHEWLKLGDLSLKDHTLLVNCPDESTRHALYMSKAFLKLHTDWEESFGLDIVLNSMNLSDHLGYLDAKDSKEKGLIQEVVAKVQDENGRIKRKVIWGEMFSQPAETLEELLAYEGLCAPVVRVFDSEIIETKQKRIILKLSLTDETNSVGAKMFLSKRYEAQKILDEWKGQYAQIQGQLQYDHYDKAKTITINHIVLQPKETVEDSAPKKRIELHAHTKMSSLDGVISVEDLIDKAASLGHQAVAITDHGVVQAYPNAMKHQETKHPAMKIIYGIEANMVDDDPFEPSIPFNKETTYVVFDIETTGLSALDNRITEIGAVKIRDGKILDHFSTFVNPGVPIPQKIVELTKITDAMVADAPSVTEAITAFLDFCQGAVLVAHNSDFDMGFIRKAATIAQKVVNYSVLDTLDMARRLYPQLNRHRLGDLCKYYNIDLRHAHRAIHDAKATGEVFIKMLEELEHQGIATVGELAERTRGFAHKKRAYHAVILVKNQEGLKNLYRLVSESHLKTYYREPVILKSRFKELREGLLLGSACGDGELYEGIVRNMCDEELKQRARFYDYVEVQPEAQHTDRLMSENVMQPAQLREINNRLITLGDEMHIPVVATGDVHILNPQDGQYRDILLSLKNRQLGPFHYEKFFRTTEEMMAAFAYLGEDKAKEIVVDNTHYIADQIEVLRPIPKGTFVPKMASADQEIQDITWQRAKELYGDPLPELVKKRIKRELDSIISNGYAVLYIIAMKIVKKSIEDGYMVGSRGSVGSSVVAMFMGITEVNPLVPHYRCPKCRYSHFFENSEYASGLDMKDEVCPHCGTPLVKDGHDIPFEVFLGFEGDKEPDIDLNFASVYQSRAHKFTEELFGRDYVYRAGTIGTVAQKTARGYVLKYTDRMGKVVENLEVDRLAYGCEGVKRTSGQHPGGVMVVPEGYSILDFTPIQYPADDPKSGVVTTHFDYHAISETILKLDLLGHEGPFAIKLLEDMTGTNANEIPTDDPEVMSLFHHANALQLDQEIFSTNTGTMGIPEFGTGFVRQMLLDTKPEKFSDLVRISGLSHGTNVWLGNAQELIRSGEAVIGEVVSTREDIMLRLIAAGMEKKRAFTIMERVRKGKGLTEEDEKEMEKLDIPQWYIPSCNQISYLFPRAHAVAYVLMSFRIAYYKLNYPEAFYAVRFTIDIDDFDGATILQGPLAIKDRMKEAKEAENKSSAKKEETMRDIYELALEMYARGVQMLPVDLYASDADHFTLEHGKIRPPLRALMGVGSTVAQAICEERKQPFNSIEDLAKRAKVNKTVLQLLKDYGCLQGLSEKDQLSFF